MVPLGRVSLLSPIGEWITDVISAYYGLSLNNPVILQAIGYSGGPTVYKMLLNTAVGNTIIVLAGAVPGYWVTVATVDTIGRKPIQIGGFAILTVIFIVMGFAYDKVKGSNGHGLLALYVLAQFVSWLDSSNHLKLPNIVTVLQLRPQRNHFHRTR